MIKILMGSMETMMTNLLFKNDFTEIILDTTESKTIQKRIYSLDPRAKKANKSVLVQLDKFSSTNPEQTELSDIVNLMQKETVSVSHLLKSQLKDLIYHQRPQSCFVYLSLIVKGPQIIESKLSKQ